MNELELSLTSAIVWCTGRHNLNLMETCYRTAEFFPKTVVSTDDSNITYLEFTQLRSLVDQVVSKRNEFIKNNVKIPSLHGRILCFYPQASNNDAMVESECNARINSVFFKSKSTFIDEFDNPPWDTWLFCELNESIIALYSWVPPELVEIVSNAIAADAYGCLVWAEELEKQLKLNM